MKKDQHAETFVVETSARVVLGSYFFLGVGGIGTRERVASPKRFMRQATRKDAEDEERREAG